MTKIGRKDFDDIIEETFQINQIIEYCSKNILLIHYIEKEELSLPLEFNYGRFLTIF